MKIAGVASDYALEIGKKKGFNFLAPVIENEGKFYLQRHENEEIFLLIELLEHITDEESKRNFVGAFLETTDLEKVGSIYNRRYKLLEYEPDFGNIGNLDCVDERFHIQPDLDIVSSELIMGISYDEDIFIGNKHFIVSQMELLVGDELSLDELDLLYRVYGMAEQFDKMGEIIDKALHADLDIRVQADWQHRLKHYRLTMETEELLNERRSKMHQLLHDEGVVL